MKASVYNVAVACGVALISVGAGMVYLPAGLITGDALVLVLTIAGARIAGRAG